jgi:hypothetical protein
LSVLSQVVTEKSNDLICISEIEYDEIKADILAGLTYLEDEQIQKTIDLQYYKGEWPIFISLRKPMKLEGKSKFYDSNSFGVIPIQISLSEMYLHFPEYVSIPAMLEKSMPHILSYRTDSLGTFGFWQSLPPGKMLRKNRKSGFQPDIKRPNHFPLRTEFTNNFVNVFDDTDDQALALHSMLLYNRVMEKAGSAGSLVDIPDSIPVFFEKYRDINRNNILLFDLKNGSGYNTGAFLTWYGKEYKFERPGGISYYANNISWFLPMSCLHTPDYVPHIPFSTNDVDVVVNANILTMLADFNLLDSTRGVSESLEFIRKKVAEADYERVSLYYPNKYQLHYVVSRVYAASKGQCLQSEAEILISDLKSHQQADGSWLGKRGKNKADIVQSTVNALLALLNFENYDKNKSLDIIRKAVLFLHENSMQENESKYWEGGIFFCAGMYVGHWVSWQSDCYTTALVIEAFTKYRKVIEQNELILVK